MKCWQLDVTSCKRVPQDTCDKEGSSWSSEQTEKMMGNLLLTSRPRHFVLVYNFSPLSLKSLRLKNGWKNNQLNSRYTKRFGVSTILLKKCKTFMQQRCIAVKGIAKNNLFSINAVLLNVQHNQIMRQLE